MGKFLVRVTIVFTSLYLLLSYLLAQLGGIDILKDGYSILFELCVVVYAYSEGKYHCKHIKHTALAILLSDTLTRLDNTYNFLSVTEHNLIPIVILAVGMSVSIISALHHFYRVIKLRKQLRMYENNNRRQF
jgi:hypothetical protein